MTSSVVSNTCRITVISAGLRADLAVPVQIPVAELLATLVGSLGRQVADDGAAQGGWVLQRASEPPLDPSATLAASQLRDGDVLHLRTRATQLPEIAFDDVLDAVGTGVQTRTARWNDSQTGVATVLFACAALAIALVSALFTGPSWAPTAIAAGSVAAILLAVAAALRPLRRGAALVSASFATAFAAVGGATAVGGEHHLLHFGAPQLLVGACAALLAVTVALLVVGAGIPGFVTVLGAAALSAIGTAVASETSLSGPGTAALVASVALAVSPILPMLSFRLSRLPLPSIPNDAADLRRDTASIDSTALLRQAFRADQYLTGLLGGVTVSIAGAAVILATGGTSERILSLVLAAICLLRARLFTGRAQRYLLLGAGAAAIVAAVVAHAMHVTGLSRVVGVVAPAAVVAVALLVLAVVLPGRRYAPPWARTADLIETLLVLSVIPLALGVMGG
jgi:type VII secretion integral membrane protein EccD